MPDQHVIILGGGMAGCCLAIALAKQHIRSTIVEIRPSPSTSGGALMLAPNALRILDKVAGVYDQVKAAGYAVETVPIYVDQTRAGKVWLGDVAGTGYPAIRCRRPTLHKVLLAACVQQAGLVKIRYGETLHIIEETDTGVVALFESGLRIVGERRTCWIEHS